MESKKNKIRTIQNLLKGERPERPRKVWLLDRGKCNDPDYPDDVREYDTVLTFECDDDLQD